MERLVKSFLLDVNQVQMVVKATKGCKVFAMQESFSTFIVVWFVVLIFGFGSFEGFSFGSKRGHIGRKLPEGEFHKC